MPRVTMEEWCAIIEMLKAKVPHREIAKEHASVVGNGKPNLPIHPRGPPPRHPTSHFFASDDASRGPANSSADELWAAVADEWVRLRQSDVHGCVLIRVLAEQDG